MIEPAKGLGQCRRGVCLSFLSYSLLIITMLWSLNVKAEAPVLFVDSELTVGYDDNLSQAERERDTVEDHFLEAQLGLLYNHEINFNAAVSFKGFLSGQAFETADSLNRGSAGLEASLRYQPTFGFLAPFYRLTLTAQLDEYDSEQRDSDILKAQLSGTKRITDKLTGTLGAEYRYRDSEGSVWDNKDWRFFINGDLMLTKRLALYSTYSFLTGDVTSSAQVTFCNGLAADDIYGLIQSSTAIEFDDAFSNDFCGDWVAYRLDGTTNAIMTGLNYGFNHSVSLDASMLWASINGDGDNDYYRRVYRFSLLARF